MASVRGATLLGPDKLEVREYPVPDIPPDGGLVKVEMGGVCGTDVKYLHGKLKVDYPIILGHEILGRVEKLGRNAAQIHKVKEGDRIILKGALGCGRCADCRRNNQRFCRQRTNYGGRTKCDQPPHLFGGFADYIYLAPDVLATKVSDALPAEAAALIGSVMANGFQWAIRRGGVKMGDYVLIQGPGQQGLSCTFASKHAGAAKIFITGIGRDKPRLELAKKFGADRTINVEEEDVVEVIRKETNGEMCDVVVDVSGNPNAISEVGRLPAPPGHHGARGVNRRCHGDADAHGQTGVERNQTSGLFYRRQRRHRRRPALDRSDQVSGARNG